jgi:glucokinase
VNAEAIGLDVGGTKTAALRISPAGEPLARSVVPTHAEDPEASMAAAERAVADVLGPAVRGIGVGAAGLIDTRSGTILTSPNFVWRQVPLGPRLAERFGLPVTVDNDATVAAWGEARLGASRGFDDSLFVGVGTGIGGGIVIDGRIVRGAHGFAGEIGHVIVDPSGPACGCGNRGCWEQVASGQAIERAAARAIAEDPGSTLATLADGDPQRGTGEVVVEAARDGDPIAVAILTEIGRRLGEGIAGFVNVLDPQIVVVGGGVAAAGDVLLEPARRACLAAIEGADVRPEVPIVPAALGSDAGAIGAGLLAIEAAG